MCAYVMVDRKLDEHPVRHSDSIGELFKLELSEFPLKLTDLGIRDLQLASARNQS